MARSTALRPPRDVESHACAGTSTRARQQASQQARASSPKSLPAQASRRRRPGRSVEPTATARADDAAEPYGSGRQARPSSSANAASRPPSPTKPALTSTGSAFVIVVVGRSRKTCSSSLGALGRVVLAAGEVGDGPQRVLVDAAPEAARPAAEPAAAAEPEPAGARRLAADELLAAVRLEVAAGRRPEPDRVDPHPAVDRLLGGIERRRAGVVRAVGEQHDDVGHVRALDDRIGRQPRAAGQRGLRATLGSTSAMASIEARIPSPIAVRRPVVRLWIASTSACWSLVGGWITAARPLKATRPISEPGRLAGHERHGRLLGGLEAGGVDVGRAHAPGHVHREQDRGLVRGHADRTTTGRPRAMTSAARPAANRANGRWRRRRDAPGIAARISDRLE